MSATVTSPKFGSLTAPSPEEYEAEMVRVRSGATGLGALTADAPPPPAAPPAMPSSPLGLDYTVAELTAALSADPLLAEALTLAELQRPQGPRKGALAALLTLPLPDAVKALAEEGLSILNTPQG